MGLILVGAAIYGSFDPTRWTISHTVYLHLLIYLFKKVARGYEL